MELNKLSKEELIKIIKEIKEESQNSLNQYRKVEDDMSTGYLGEKNPYDQLNQLSNTLEIIINLSEGEFL